MELNLYRVPHGRLRMGRSAIVVPVMLLVLGMTLIMADSPTVPAMRMLFSIICMKGISNATNAG